MSDIMITDNGDGADIVIREPMVEGTILSETTSTDASPEALRGTISWALNGQFVNDKPVAVEASGKYVCWKSLRRGNVVTSVSNIGNENAVNYFREQDYPDAITVRGTGTISDETIPFIGFTTSEEGKSFPLYEYETAQGITRIYTDNTPAQWWVQSADFALGDQSTWYDGLEDLPAKDQSSWTLFYGTATGIPTLSYTIPTGQYRGFGTFSGLITVTQRCACYSTSNADFYEDTGIGTAVYLSMFDEPGWMEALKPASERVPSAGKLRELLDKPIVAGTVSKIQRTVTSNLSWLVDQGACSAITVSVQNPSLGLIEIDIEATEPEDTLNRYKALWDQQEQELTSFVRNSDRKSVILR